MCLDLLSHAKSHFAVTFVSEATEFRKSHLRCCSRVSKLASTCNIFVLEVYRNFVLSDLRIRARIKKSSNNVRNELNFYDRNAFFLPIFVFSSPTRSVYCISKIFHRSHAFLRREQ